MNIMNEHPSFSKLWVVITITVLIGLSALAVSLVIFSDSATPDPVDEVNNEDGDTSDWLTYTSSEYDFSIMHPPEWEVSAYSPSEVDAPRMIVPTVNIYPKGSTAPIPFDHHADVVNVSVFPHGVPTEGVSGEIESSNVQFGVSTEEPANYVLSDGSPWATITHFESVPESWESYGFIWARASIGDLEIECISEGGPVSSERCDSLTGDHVIRTGSVNESIREIQVKMLESFEFDDR